MSFLHSARTPRDIIYRRELDHMDSRVDNFNIHTVASVWKLAKPEWQRRFFYIYAQHDLPGCAERSVLLRT